MNARRSERLMGGNDRVGLVRVELVLGGQRAFAGCGGEVAGAAEDQEPMLARKGGSEWVEC